MDFDFGNRGGKLQKEQEKRRAEAKARIARERRAQDEAAALKARIDEQNRLRKLEQQRKEEEERQRQLEEERRTGGIRYQEALAATVAAGEGDKIVLPASALAQLSQQDAISLGPMLFELTATSGTHTHAGVLEFSAEEGNVGLPLKVAESLGAADPTGPADLGLVTVKYVRLPRATFVRWTPLDTGLSQVGELKPMLEENLHKHATVTEGDTVRVWYRGRRFRVRVAEVRAGAHGSEAVPGGGASLIDTDVEVVLDLPAEAQKAADENAARRRSQTLRSAINGDPAAEAAAVAAASAPSVAVAAVRASPPRSVGNIMVDSDEEEEEDEDGAPKFDAEAHRLTKLGALPEEPPLANADVVTCLVKTASTRLSRRFRKGDVLSTLFDFVEAGGAPPGRYRIVVPYPRRVLAPEIMAGKTFAEAGLLARQEALILEVF